jgi:hypothetical protein
VWAGVGGGRAQRWSAQKSTNGGSSDTDANEFAVRPYRVPSESQLVTTVTPVVKTV